MKNVSKLFGIFIALLAMSLPQVALSAPSNGNSNAAHACQQNGYLSLVGAQGQTFKNVGACVSFAAHGGTFATGIIIPAGHTATFTDPTLSACNDITYGYQLNFGSNVPLANKGYDCDSILQSDTTIGPYATATLLRVFLTDNTCSGVELYSDGNHALVTQISPSNSQVDIMDEGGTCEAPSSTDRFPDFPGAGNLDVHVVISP